MTFTFSSEVVNSGVGPFVLHGVVDFYQYNREMGAVWLLN